MSRYDFFTENSEGYPDVYALNNDIFTSLADQAPLLYQLTKPDAERFDLLLLQFYNSTEYMWIILWFNGLSNIFELTEGMYLMMPTLEFLTSLQETSWRR